MFIVSVAFSSLAQYQKLKKGGWGGRNETFWCNFNISFFLKVSLNACENSSLTVEDIHY